MKKLFLFLFVFLFCFSGCSQKTETEISKKTEFFCGIVEENVYSNKLFGINFEIPENWETIAPDISENSLAFIDDWSFEEKGNIGSTEMYITHMTKGKTDEDVFEYIYNFVDEIYGDTIVEKNVKTIMVGEEERDFVLIHAIDGDFECYIGVFGRIALYDDENWLLWTSALFETEEKVINAIEILTSGKIKREKIVPSCGEFDGRFFKNESFGIGFVVPKDWIYEEPETLPYEKTESFYDGSFYSSYGFGGLCFLYKYFYDIEITEKGLLEIAIKSLDFDTDSDEFQISAVKISGNEQDCLFGCSEGKYSVYIPKIVENGDETGWACMIIFTGDSYEALLEYIGRLTWDIENLENIEAEINKDYDFDFIPGKIENNIFRNDFTGVTFTAPENSEYEPDEELFNENNEYGFFEDFYCIGDLFDVSLYYQKYNYFGGKAATLGNTFALTFYDEDNKYGFVLLSEEIEKMNYCGYEIYIETEIYDTGKKEIYLYNVIVEKETYIIVFTMIYFENQSSEELLSYIHLDNPNT